MDPERDLLVLISPDSVQATHVSSVSEVLLSDATNRDA